MDTFKIQSKESWLNLLCVTEKDLKKIIDNKANSYSKHEISKSSGNLRTIYCIDNSSEIYALQNKLKKMFFINIFLPECVCGFRKNYSYIDFLIPHTSTKNNQLYLRLDIKNFFESIAVDLFRKFLKYYIDK